ncbi:MAG: hypothetical protein A3J46_04995 [Candidatus Yanofskybacteria bacterium RIFCSPHIGHO2_02_FULL_41_11]|uniref:ABC transporter ATP-binding protein n=1 Tax=Candidatus Yanofskybacteria bacterium RIFCSPHIGHO2_02_FULL_41_11 TaxID=1802675 RepID=A0A1F8F741_9BACT|nr:MAG: hypothetical protein A3J46_04995 [Candidatus Yanofskybacteria bacterium RIFCSPHIGHO2_02_FULL_41_11]
MAILNIKKLSTAIDLIRHAFSGYKKQFIITLILGLIAGLFGGIGIGAIIPLFAFINKDGQRIEELDSISLIIERFFGVLGLEYSLFFLIVMVVALFTLKAAITYLSFYLNEKIATSYENKARKNLFRKTLKADWPFLLEQRIGHLESVLMQDTYMSSGILSNINAVIMTGTSMLMYAFIAINISASITFLTLGLGVVLFFLLRPFFYKIRKLSENFGKTYRNINNHVSEHMIGSKTIKSIGAEDKVIDSAMEDMELLRKIRIDIALYNKAPGAFLEPLGFVFISILLLFYYHYDPMFNIASFAAIMYLVQKKISFMQGINTRLNSINEALPHLQTVIDFEKHAEDHEEKDEGDLPFSFEKEMSVKNVSFAYNSDRRVLNNLSLNIKRGEMVGLIGPSGAGKTTLVDILLRLFRPGSGEILIDGKNINDIRVTEWRKKVSYVSQEIFLLNDTIENNIKFYDASISDKDIVEATKMANIYDFIYSLPDNFKTIVGERGVRLSGGQRQRIILARALARKPEVLILDEATSALDNESEVLIQKSIESLKNQVTVLAIAHRLSTVMNSDRLIVMDNGKIIEEGKPSELLENKDSYFYKAYNIREN